MPIFLLKFRQNMGPCLPALRHGLGVVLPLPLELVWSLPGLGDGVGLGGGDGAPHPVYVRLAVVAAALHVLHDLPLGAELRPVWRHEVGVHLVAAALPVDRVRVKVKILEAIWPAYFFQRQRTEKIQVMKNPS